MDKRKKTTTKQRALHRISIIQGHLKKVAQMLEEDNYCVDVVHQSLAIQKALRKLDMLIMEDHLKNCVVDQIKNKEEDRSVNELLKLFELK